MKKAQYADCQICGRGIILSPSGVWKHYDDGGNHSAEWTDHDGTLHTAVFEVVTTPPRALMSKTLERHPAPWRVDDNDHALGWGYSVVDAEGNAVCTHLSPEAAELVALLPAVIDFTVEGCIERWVNNQ